MALNSRRGAGERGRLSVCLSSAGAVALSHASEFLDLSSTSSDFAAGSATHLFGQSTYGALQGQLSSTLTMTAAAVMY